MAVVRSADGVEIAYRNVGNSPPTVVFMHGWAGSGAYFDALLQHLDLRRVEAVTFDFRGHGDSGRTDEGYTLDRFADDVFAVADDAGAETFVLVGFSMSGKFAQYVSFRQPERVLGQILVAGCPVGQLPLPRELIDDWYGRAGSAEHLIDIVRTYAVRPIAEDMLAALGRDAARVPLVALRGTMEAVTETSFIDKLEAATTPTLVIGGVRDPMFSPDALREGVVAPLRSAKLEVLDCGHEIPIEQPQELAALIEGFLAELS